MIQAELASVIRSFGYLDDTEDGFSIRDWVEKGEEGSRLFTTEAPIARLMPVVTGDEVRLGYWSHRRKWEDIDDMGGYVLPLDQALDHIANNSVFWT